MLREAKKMKTNGLNQEHVELQIIAAKEERRRKQKEESLETPKTILLKEKINHI